MSEFGAPAVRRVASLVVPMCAVALIALIGPMTARASAHAALTSTTPPGDEVVDRVPSEVKLEFDESVEVVDGGVRVFGPSDDRVDRGVVQTLDGGLTVVAPIDDPGIQGTYTVSWRVLPEGSPHLDGTAATPVTLEPVDDDGRFRATVEFPSAGTWTVRFTAITPEATVEVPQQVDPPATTTTTVARSTTTSEGESTSTSEAPADEDEDGEASKAGTFVFVAVLLILAVAALVIGRGVRQRRQLDAESPGASERQPE